MCLPTCDGGGPIWPRQDGVHRTVTSKENLEAALREQVSLMMMACKSFDEGKEFAAKHLAIGIRIMLHQTAMSQSLLQQLNLRSGRFEDTSGKFNHKNLLTSQNLCGLRAVAGHPTTRYVPLFTTGVVTPFKLCKDFAEWWNEPVLKDTKGNLFCRRDLVLEMTNTDGGGHIDPDLDAAYQGAITNTTMGWTCVLNGVEINFPGPVNPSIRQIAHEVLLTLQRTSPGSFEEPYLYAVTHP